MTRVIAGSHGGRRLRTPKGDRTRPTSDRVREALFSALESRIGDWDEVAFVDLFAGSGAIGIEALSRGARSADFVESHSGAARIIGRNLSDLELAGRVHRTTAEAFVQASPGPFDVGFVDPPYALAADDLTRLLRTACENGVWADGAVIVVERSSRAGFTWPAAIEPDRERRYGETALWYGRFHA